MRSLDITAEITGEDLVVKDTAGLPHPSRSEIALLAYDFYEKRGRKDGRDVDDWLSAERELRHHYLG